MVKIVEPSRSPETDSFMVKVREFFTYKKQIEKLTKSQNEIKAELVSAVEEFGETDDKGHIWLTLPEEVDGFSSLQRQRRVSQSLDYDAALELLREKGLYEKCVKQMPVVDEDAVMSAVYEGSLTEEDVDIMFPKTVSWAFVPSKK